MYILFQEIIRTGLIVIGGLCLMAFAEPLFSIVAPTKGRLKRIPFAWRYTLVFLLSHIFYILIDKMIDDVVHLTAYGFIQILYFLGTIVFVPFYYSLVSRRLKDFSMPVWITWLWIFFLIFGHRYAVVSSVHFFFVLFQSIGILLLFFIPTLHSQKRLHPKNIRES